MPNEEFSIREALERLGCPERLLPNAIATFKTLERAERWIDVLGHLALRSEYLYEISASGLEPEDCARWLDAGFNALSALRLPRRLASAGLGVDDYLRWKSAGLGSGLESFVPHLKSDLTFEELLSILKRWNTEHDSDCSEGVGELAELLRSGLKMEELRRLLGSGLSGHHIYKWRKTGIPASDWPTWIGFGFDAETAAEYSAGGVSAATAKDWKPTGLSVHDALSFIETGVAPTIAREWIDCGITGTGALAFIEKHVPMDTASVWVKAGLSPSEAAGFIEKDVALDEALKLGERGISSSQLTRTESGLGLDLDPWQEDPVDQLPSVIAPGSINFTLWTTEFGDPQAFDISFKWDGDKTADWDEDISPASGDLSPASSTPVWGVASWPVGNDVLLTYTCSDLGLQGYDRLRGAAPTRGDPQGAKDPRQWIRFGEALLNFVFLEVFSGRDTPEDWSAEYYDRANDAVLDLHEMFRIFLNDAGRNAVLPDFSDWLRGAVSAGTYEIVDDE